MKQSLADASGYMRHQATFNAGVIGVLLTLLYEVGVLTAQVRAMRPVQAFPDVPRGAWIRPVDLDYPEVDGREWSLVISVTRGGKLPHADTLRLGDGARVKLSELSGYVFTRDPFAREPIEWPCQVGAETGDNL